MPVGAGVNGKPWMKAEDDVLRAVYPRRGRSSRNPWAKLCRVLPGRTRVAIKVRARKIGLHRSLVWTAAEDAYLRREWGEVGRRTVEAALPTRTWSAIVQRVNDLGLSTIPQGWVTLSEACRRTGYDFKQLHVIIAWTNAQEKARLRACGSNSDPHALGVRTRQHTATWSGRASKQPWVWVEWDALEAAIARWLKTERAADAARRLGLRYMTLLHWLEEDGLHGRVKRGQKRHEIRFEPDVYDRVAQARMHRPDGLSIRAHAKRLGMDDTTLWQRLRRAGVIAVSSRRKHWLTVDAVDQALARAA